MTKGQIVSDICGRMNLVSQEAITRVGQAVDRHYRRVTATVGLEQIRYITRTAQTALNSDQVTFTGIEKLDRVYERGADGLVRVLNPVPLAAIREGQELQGSRYGYAVYHQTATDITILLPGLALAITDLYADGWTTLANMADTDKPNLPESFHDILTFEVVAEEYLRKGNTDLADRFKSQADTLLKELRFHIADAPAIDWRQGDNVIPGAGGGGTGGSGSSVITGDIVFDRDPGPPFDVTPGSGMVANLDADKLDGQHGAFYQNADNLNAGTVPPARLPPQPPPLPHHTTHEAGGSDAIRLDALAAPTDVTTLNASTAAHGLLQKLSGVATQFLNGMGAWVAVAVGLHAPTHQSGGTDPVDVKTLAGYPGGTANFLRADATFAVPPGGGGGGVPGGATTQVQFNDSGAFGGDAGLTFDKTTKAIAATGDLSIVRNLAHVILQFLGSTTKARVMGHVADVAALSVNADFNGTAWVRDDAAKTGAILSVLPAALYLAKLDGAGFANTFSVATADGAVNAGPVSCGRISGSGEIALGGAGAADGIGGVIRRTTADGADTGYIAIVGGGDNAGGATRGARLIITGNEYGAPGSLYADIGAVAAAAFVVRSNGGTVNTLAVDGATGLTTLMRPATKMGAAPTFAAPNLTFDLATGSAFVAPNTSGTFTHVFLNPPPAGVEFVFSIQHDVTGACTASFPANVTWDEDVPPTFPGAGRTIILGFSTINGGARWRGYIGGRNFLT